MQLADVGMGLQGLTLLRDPIANNLRQYMYLQMLRLGIERAERKALPEEDAGVEGVLGGEDLDKMAPEDVIQAVRALRFNGLLVPKWLAAVYMEIQNSHPEAPVLPLSRADKVVTQVSPRSVVCASCLLCSPPFNPHLSSPRMHYA
jgi:hypothetical protein